MIVLGMDTATSATSVALALDGEDAAASILEARDDPPAGARPGHATRLLGMAGELLAQAGLGFGAVQCVAVGVGPGTFTGLRVGVASARGLAQSLGVELRAVSSLRALAAEALRAIPGPGSRPIATIDARRGEVFAAAFDPELHELAPPRALAPQRLGELLADAGLEGAQGVFAIGDGALRHREQIERLGVSVPAEGSPLHLVRARAICALATTERAEPLHEVLPDYRRAPDAELALGGASAS